MTLGWGHNSNITKLQLQSQFQRFLYQTLVCVLENKIYNTNQTEVSFWYLGRATGLGLWGAGGSNFLALGLAMAPH